MFKSLVYMGEEFLGQVEIYPQGGDGMHNKMEKIQICYFSQPSDRCPPLAVLQTITSSSSGYCFKMESDSYVFQSQDSPLSLLHSSCIRENKTAVILLGNEELHLVAMYSRNNSGQYPCFWAFSARTGLYNSCLIMLNMRCLGIVFDLDETLIVANTMRSFEDRIEALSRKISMDADQQRISGMLAEVKRYQDDKNILKQYIENDQVVENGTVLKTQSELVPALSESHQPIARPVIRIHEKNIILTRINPLIRDTSVLVRLRPAWEDLRSYLIARGRKRFEVYVCTMAEREYALEMWRLLDPEFNLISSTNLLKRIVCVKSGLKKSLFDVFQDRTCHPKMALVIDDRLKVWDEKDQGRVHVVPAFAPYYTPQAEANNAAPTLCVARNVACNVRGGFFKEFDECFLQRIAEIAYEDDCRDIFSPDVSTYLVPEDNVSAGPNGNEDPLTYDGMADAEVESRPKEVVAASSARAQLDPRHIASLHNTVASSSNRIALPASVSATAPSSRSSPNPPVAPSVKHFGHAEQVMQNSPAREEGEVPESELDPDTRRRLLILQHGQDFQDQATIGHFPASPSILDSAPSRGRWVGVAEEPSPNKLSRTTPNEYPVGSDMLDGKQRSNHPPPLLKIESSPLLDRLFHESLRLPKEMHSRDQAMRSMNTPSAYNSFSVSGGREHECSQTSSNGEAPAVVLLDIAMKCGAKVEFRPGLVASMSLQFSVEAWFGGEKICEGFGRTRREAQHQAAEGCLRHLANIYMARNGTSGQDINRISPVKENGLFEGLNCFTKAGVEDVRKEEQWRLIDARLEGCKKSGGDCVSVLRDLCMMKGVDVEFQLEAELSDDKEIHVKVEIDGEVVGRGSGSTWEEAKMHGAERALGYLRSLKRRSPAAAERGRLYQQGGGGDQEEDNNNNKRVKLLVGEEEEEEYPDSEHVVGRQMYSSSTFTSR